MATTTNHLGSARRTAKEVDGVPVRRAVAVMALIGVAVIHLMDAPDKFEEVPYMGVLFVALIVASLLLAEVLIRHDDLRAWLAAGALAAATIIGYTLSRSVGLPGEGGAEIGNWKEALGLASLLVEGVLVWMALARLMLREPAR